MIGTVRGFEGGGAEDVHTHTSLQFQLRDWFALLLYPTRSAFL